MPPKKKTTVSEAPSEAPPLLNDISPYVPGVMLDLGFNGDLELGDVTSERAAFYAMRFLEPSDTKNVRQVNKVLRENVENFSWPDKIFVVVDGAAYTDEGKEVWSELRNLKLFFAQHPYAQNIEYECQNNTGFMNFKYFDKNLLYPIRYVKFNHLQITNDVLKAFSYNVPWKSRTVVFSDSCLMFKHPGHTFTNQQFNTFLTSSGLDKVVIEIAFLITDNEIDNLSQGIYSRFFSTHNDFKECFKNTKEIVTFQYNIIFDTPNAIQRWNDGLNQVFLNDTKMFCEIANKGYVKFEFNLI